MGKTKELSVAMRLADEIMRHKRLYYTGSPEISDADYDQLEARLERLMPEHPALQTVGDGAPGKATKVNHATPMLSLQKTYDEEELLQWCSKYPVVGSWKIDGNSLSLVYEKGRLVQAKTRGNGRVGEEVTDKIRWVTAIPGQLSKSLDVEIRGELYCSEHRFAELVEEMLALNLERPNNPRNIVAGMLGRKVHTDLCRFFGFFAFDVHSSDQEASFESETKKFAWLEKEGFALPNPKRLVQPQQIQSYLQAVKEEMAEGKLGLDGAVFSYDKTSLHEELGHTSHHPRFKMSFKWQGQTAAATIEKISWATSRLGVVTPVAMIEPVELSGAKITNITLHNAEHVKAYNLKKCDQIEIVRSGEVIPKFLRVLKAATGEYRWPAECPSCSTPLDFDGVRLRCPNRQSCPAQQSGTILNWIRSVEIDDLSEKRLESMLEADLIDNPASLYRLRQDDFLSLPLVKDKMARKLYENIQKSRQVDLARFLTGLGIAGTGLTSWEKILSQHPTLKAIRQLSTEDLVAIDGFAEKSAEAIVDGLRKKSDLIEELLEVGVKPKKHVVVSAAASDAPLLGRQLVITGSLSQPRKKIEEIITAAGGKVSSSVSKNTYAIVANDQDSASSKMKKAKELGVPIWNEDALDQILGISSKG